MMSEALSPIVSEFETIEQEAAYTAWLQTKVAASLADGRPTIPHDEVMGEMEAIITAAEQRRQSA
ncbi:type II toxin-antitoxin system RelB family antitoxin [Acetobacter senegalensis]|uniref:type II toxin-antitoxin system RelB family antitoxin n=1 Tax=Acetobacter senegalensis TaxID=446692 RepID=UPI00264C9AD7|nr:antitoxin [Acetobacter senegalensis]MDN7352161.1 antitoxin [Acetobacter senegalensis]